MTKNCFQLQTPAERNRLIKAKNNRIKQRQSGAGSKQHDDTHISPAGSHRKQML